MRKIIITILLLTIPIICFAEDKNGQKWQYINRYTDTRTPLFFIPFLITAGPLREFNNISLQSASSTKGE